VRRLPPENLDLNIDDIAEAVDDKEAMQWVNRLIKERDVLASDFQPRDNGGR
jgi:hypothetical protein